MVVQLTPGTATPGKPARRTKSNVHLRLEGNTRAFFPTDEQMPIVAALAGKIVEGYLDDRRSFEQLQIAFTDRLPTAPDAAHWIVHAGCVSLLPIGRKSIEIARVEGFVKLDQCVERIAAAALRFTSRNFSQSYRHDAPPSLRVPLFNHSRRACAGCARGSSSSS